jgi:hypothetical protein
MPPYQRTPRASSGRRQMRSGASVIPQPDGLGGLMCAGKEWVAHVDIANCKLPQVSWVIPDGAWSDHAGPATTALSYGPSWVAAVINAIGDNPACPTGTQDAGQIYWENTAVLSRGTIGWLVRQPARRRPGDTCLACSRILPLAVPATTNMASVCRSSLCRLRRLKATLAIRLLISAAPADD